ncbi:MAG: type II toxin-antitoxin system YhaV family toxin [Terracidiphilus sp.]|jgi:toxin YhaV
MIVNGWRLYVSQRFNEQLQLLEDQVEVFAAKDPIGCTERPVVKLLAAIQRLIFEVIPRDPNAPEFRQGKTLGAAHRHWFRAKFHQRYRLFYRFSSKEKVIVYAWMSDERTLRKSGSKTDPYHVFRGLLEAGDPPSTMEQLLARARELKD